MSMLHHIKDTEGSVWCLEDWHHLFCWLKEIILIASDCLFYLFCFVVVVRSWAFFYFFIVWIGWERWSWTTRKGWTRRNRACWTKGQELQHRWAFLSTCIAWHTWQLDLFSDHSYCFAAIYSLFPSCTDREVIDHLKENHSFRKGLFNRLTIFFDHTQMNK